jgi:hypothetical protein
LIVLVNQSMGPNHWLGLRLPDDPGTGWAFRIHAGGRMQERRLAAGESHRSQSAGYVHFGLGQAPAVESLEVLPPGSQRWRRVEPVPPIDRWSEIRLSEPAR